MSAIFNKLLNLITVFFLLSFCWPGTHLEKRLVLGQKGINPLDATCREHNIAYSKTSSFIDRHKADFQLENRAWERVKSKDVNLGEKAPAWVVTTAMKSKRKMGMGVKKRGGSFSFRQHVLLPILKTLTKTVEGKRLEKQKYVKKSSLFVLRAARNAVKKAGGRKKIRVSRIIPFERKTGNILPLIPIFAGLSALGSLAGGSGAIAKAVIDAQNAKKKLAEDHRLNSVMEEIGKKGSDLYLKKSPKRGYGLFLKKQKNFQ